MACWASSSAAAAPALPARAAEMPLAAPHTKQSRELPDEDSADDDWTILDHARHIRRQAILLSGGAWADRVTAGVWYGLPLAHEGILPHINDGITLDVGGDYTWLHDAGESTHGLWLAVGPRWDFYLTRAWALYAALRVGLFVTLDTTPRGGPNFFQPGVGMGGLYRVSQRLRLGLDFSYPQGLRFGLSIDLDD